MAHSVPGDISDENFCRQLIEKSLEAPGGIDILVNVAGAQKAQEYIAVRRSRAMLPAKPMA
jgi:NAD(P)-dependent dehydrogenase (short-subunit alcohol dehydrogenase family)